MVKRDEVLGKLTAVTRSEGVFIQSNRSNGAKNCLFGGQAHGGFGQRRIRGQAAAGDRGLCSF